MDTSTFTDASPDGFRRSSPLVIVSHVIRGFAIAGAGKILGLLVKSSGVAVLALYVISALQTFGVHWSIRLLVVCVCVLIVQLVISVFKYMTLQFRYDDTKISTKKGFGTQNILDFEWFNVRTFRLTRSMFQRRLNLASISVTTAGSSETAIEIPYIPYSLALEWEQRVRRQKLQDDDGESTETETDSLSADSDVTNTHQERAFLHKLNLRDLVRATFAGGNVLADALVGFFMVGVGYCLYRFIYQILMLAPNIFDLDDGGPVQLFWSQAGSMIRDLPSNFVADATSLLETFQQITGLTFARNSVGGLMFFISLALILASLFYLIFRIWYVVRHFNFEMTQQGIHLRTEEGVTTKRRMTIRRDRVQSTSFRANFVERALDRGNVNLDSASKFDCSIPYVTTECANRIFHAVTDESRVPVTLTPIGQRFTPIHVLSLIQKLVTQVVFILPITLILIGSFFPTTRGLIWPYSLILLGYAVTKIYVGWRRRGYIVNDDFLLQKLGGLSWSSVRVAPLNKVQSMSIRQNLIQRMRNRATILFNFASGSQSIPFLSLAVAEAMRRTVEGRIRGDSDIHKEISEDETINEWMSLPNKYIVSRVIASLLTSVLVLVPLFFLIAWGIHSWLSISYELLGWILTSVWGALTIWRLVVVYLKIPKYRYSYSKDDIVVKESFLATQTESVRYSRLQSVCTDNGLIDGFFGLSCLILYTAEDDLIVRGLDEREAIRLREYISTRMIELSSTGTDAVTMTERESSSVDSEVSKTNHDETATNEASSQKSHEIHWRKFSGWTQEILTSFGSILIGFPLLLGSLALFVYSNKDFWIREFGENFFGFVFSWPFYIGIWSIVSLWMGTSPFIEIPRKGYSVTPDALRYKEGWLRRTFHFVPLSRIQNVSVSATFSDRIFEVRKVKISTASDDEIKLQYLSALDAEELREQLLSE